ncbi:MAG: hypothetical protein V3S69_07520, partial [Dehalococcoidales bacterium]
DVPVVVFFDEVDAVGAARGATLSRVDDRVLQSLMVELQVTETGPSFKGDTATTGTKPAELETGITIQVPLFVEEGDVIKIDTRSGNYLERVG